MRRLSLLTFAHSGRGFSPGRTTSKPDGTLPAKYSPTIGHASVLSITLIPVRNKVVGAWRKLIPLFAFCRPDHRKIVRRPTFLLGAIVVVDRRLIAAKKDIQCVDGVLQKCLPVFFRYWCWGKFAIDCNLSRDVNRIVGSAPLRRQNSFYLW